MMNYSRVIQLVLWITIVLYPSLIEFIPNFPTTAIYSFEYDVKILGLISRVLFNDPISLHYIEVRH